MIKKEDILQTLHNMYNEVAQLHHDINNCIDITCEQNTDLIDSNSELEETVRYMICELEK